MTLHMLANKESPDHSRHHHRNPPPLQQPPPILKQRLRGEVTGKGRREPLAILKQTHLEWGLSSYTCQGISFFLLPWCWQTVDDHRHGGLSIGDQQRPEAKERGCSLCRGKHLKRHILCVLLFEGYAWLTNPVTLRFQAADILTKTIPEYCLYIQMISGKSC